MLDERHIQLQNGTNFRDLGGYPTNDGRTLKWCRLIRSGDLSRLTIDDQQKLMDYGITTIIDLRSTAEVQQFPDHLINGVQWMALPILDDDETESTQTIQDLQELYSISPRGGYLRMTNVYCQLVISDQAKMAYTRFFRYLLEHGKEETIIFHCTAGKDRTGIVTILLLAALGVPVDVIREDYLLTNRYSQQRANSRIVAAREAQMNDNFLQSIRDLSLVSEDYLDRVFSIVNQAYGGMNAYLHDELELGEDDLHKLQKIYLR
ncbi:MAG TPA: tyrosine-protein phosphatase [Candidatus Levilactobacillus faecigallinarum]|uniref:Tyrosine-protein phosphatase n=1 Tax=Candidatus Levilactobacillus faecigallinarum TaxID=2838638 RepID=A0A9D1U427_9LACO|nr:tyrosine-protein phosphatase [Candidatus Levilactobacillus faecigallinarum]